MYSPSQLQKIISEKIKDNLFLKAPTELYAPINYIMEDGGKRIRPNLLLMGCNLFSDSIENAIAPAIAYEIFHNFTLLHDDVMDKSPVRRGRPTVHIKWDTNTAILSGDAMLIKAYQYIAQLASSDLPEILNLFSQTALEVCEGQQMDMNFETKNDVLIEEYLEMIRLKTSVLIAAAIKTGAIIGRANKKDANLLYKFGLNLGLAFQLQDDLLDLYGDQKVFGKRIGGDIISQKKTYLFLKAKAIAGPKTRANLIDLYSAAIDNDTKVLKVREIYNLLEMKKISTTKMNTYYSVAIEALDAVNVPSERKEELLKLTNLIKTRIR